jgi:hypothetical protein
MPCIEETGLDGANKPREIKSGSPKAANRGVPFVSPVNSNEVLQKRIGS